MDTTLNSSGYATTLQTPSQVCLQCAAKREVTRVKTKLPSGRRAKSNLCAHNTVAAKKQPAGVREFYAATAELAVCLTGEL